MELLQMAYPDTLKRYWRRRQYQRLNIKKKKVKVTRMGGGSPRFWRIKAIPKLRWKIIVSPIKLLTKLKNAYMNMMINLAGNDNTFGRKRIPKARKVPLVYSSYEFEERLVYEIYKTLIATRELSG